jgi:c-di-GMP-binding flagellar brake protein YcgR
MTTPVPSANDQTSRSPAISPLLEASDYTQYLLHNRNEILYILRSLQGAADNITVHFNDGHDFLLSAVIAVDEDGITLDYGGNAELNRRALAAERHFCVANHEKIRIQFLLRSMREISFNGTPAFHAPLPDTVLRLQRREYFRLTTPVAHPIKCRIPVSHHIEHSRSAMDANVIDISGGGLAIMVPPAGATFSAGDTFANCRVELPDVGIVVATLEVRNVFEVTLRSGAQVTRAGCQFANLPGPMLTLVQRYIIKAERERKARESGLA